MQKLFCLHSRFFLKLIFLVFLFCLLPLPWCLNICCYGIGRYSNAKITTVQCFYRLVKQNVLLKFGKEFMFILK